MSREKWKSIKIQEDTYEALRRMGTGISKAVDLLLKAQQAQLEEKLQDIEKKGAEIAEVLFRHGFFDIKFKGLTIDDVWQDSDTIFIKAKVGISIPNDAVRNRVISILKGDSDADKD
jgi:hypothetical protein